MGLYRLRKNPSAVILSVYSLAAAPDGQKLGPRKGSADLFLGPRLFLVHRGRTADLKNRSVLHLLQSTVILRSSGGPEPCEGRISQCLENTQSEILRCAQDDSVVGFFRRL